MSRRRPKDEGYAEVQLRGEVLRVVVDLVGSQLTHQIAEIDQQLGALGITETMQAYGGPVRGPRWDVERAEPRAIHLRNRGSGELHVITGVEPDTFYFIYIESGTLFAEPKERSAGNVVATVRTPLEQGTDRPERGRVSHNVKPIGEVEAGDVLARARADAAAGPCAQDFSGVEVIVFDLNPCDCPACKAARP